MAVDAKILFQSQGVEFLGGTQTQDVVVIAARSSPSGIYFEVRVPRKDYIARLAGAAALSQAAIYEGVAAVPNVAGVAYTQIPNAAGELRDGIVVTVSSTSGNSTLDLTEPLTAIGPDLLKGKIDALHAELDAAEA